MGVEVWIFNLFGLFFFDDVFEMYFKVMELCELVCWFEGMVWCLFECYGVMIGIMKVQIDWILFLEGVVCFFQGKMLVVMQVCGGFQFFNVVNQMCIFG